MTEHNKSTLYDKVIRVTHVYLGPAADRFIDRQIDSHIHKAPSKLTQKDLVQLIDWIRITVSLLTENNDIVKEYITQLEQLARPQTKLKKKTR